MKKSLFKTQIGAFTTNESTYSPVEYFTIFINNYKCQNVTKKGSKRMDFLFDLSQSHRCASSVHYIKDFEEDYPLCNIVSCYMLLIDLEDSNTQKTLDEILLYVTTYCHMEKKIYILGLYKNKDKIKLEEQSLVNQFDEKMILYEYNMLNATDLTEVIGSIDEIYNDCLESITENMKHSMVEISLARSGANAHSCLIF